MVSWSSTIEMRLLLVDPVPAQKGSGTLHKISEVTSARSRTRDLRLTIYFPKLKVDFVVELT